MSWASLHPLNAGFASTHLLISHCPISPQEEADSTDRPGLYDHMHGLNYKAGFESLASIKQKKTSSAFPFM